MTYMIDRWNEGEVKFVDGAVGWIMPVSYTHLTLPTTPYV